MKEKNPPVFTVEITKDNFLCTQNSILDAVCYALDDYLAEAAGRIFHNFDWNKYTREKFIDSQSKPNEQKAFEKLVDAEMSEAEKALFAIFPFDDKTLAVPLVIMEGISKTVERAKRRRLDIWLLNGETDVLALISRKLMTGASDNVSYKKDGDTDTLSITFTEKQAREFMGYELSEADILTVDRLTTSVIEFLERCSRERRNKAITLPVNWTERFLQETKRANEQRIKKGRWKEQNSWPSLVLSIVGVLTWLALLLLMVTARNLTPGMVTLSLFLSLFPIYGLFRLMYLGLLAHQDRWMKQEEVLLWLDRKFNLQEKIIEEIDARHKNKLEVNYDIEQAEHAFTVLSFLNHPPRYRLRDPDGNKIWHV